MLHLATFPYGARTPENVYIMYKPRRQPNIVQCKGWLASIERRRCSDETKTRNPLKVAGVPQTNETISASSEPKFTRLWGHVEEISLFMAALWNRAGHYIFILRFLSIFCLSSFYLLFFPRLISAAAPWMSTILRHMMYVALVRIFYLHTYLHLLRSSHQVV